MEEKGISNAIMTVRSINESFGRIIFILDIYGPIDEDYRENFEQLSNMYQDYINYRGIVSSGNSSDILKKYYLLLFSTYYHGEGFAGTILDALAAGVPIVASDWHYNAEIVTEDVGYIYPTHDQNGLAQILKHVAINRGEVLAKKIKCLEKASLYTEEYMLNTLARLLE